MREGIVGWDIGGAHLKAAYLDGQGAVQQVVQLPCPLWQGMAQLDHALDQALGQLPARVAQHAITMTGELVDSFASRAEGVRRLVASLATKLPLAKMNIYAGAAGFISPRQSDAQVDAVASANWMATAAFVAPLVSQGLMVDVGSTTTDIIPVRGTVLALGHDDYRRLVHEELVYTGVVRTSVIAVVQRIPFEGEWVQPMAEHFATMADIYRLTGCLPEHADQMATADNAGKSAMESARRLARLFGRDVESAPLQSWTNAANFVAEQQMTRLYDACARNLSRGVLDDEAPLIGAGVGRFIVQRLARRLARPYVDFSTFIECSAGAGDWAANCAPAVAVARLAMDRI